jgi:ferredoxin
MPRVSIKESEKTFEVNVGEILYNALSNLGEDLPHGCLAGSCGACRVEIIEGKENLDVCGVIESNTISSLKEEFAKSKGKEFLIDKEIRLSCRARVKGDISIQPIK